MKVKDYKKLFKQSEHSIQTEIINYLESRMWYTQRMNSGAIRTDKGNLVRMNRAGTPDIFALKNGKCLFIEVKRPGNKPTALQTAVMEELEQYGARCLVVHSVEELEELL